MAFHDVAPQAPVHILIIPKFRDGLSEIAKAEPKHKDILGHLLWATAEIAKEQELDDGYRIVINNGPLSGKF